MSTQLIVLFCLVASTSHAQIDSTSITHSRSVGHDGYTAIRAIGHVVTAPAGWDGDDWLHAGGVVALTTAGFLLDDEASGLVRRNQSSFNTGVSDFVVQYGNGYFTAGFTVAAYLTGIVVKDDWLRETAVLMGGTVLFTAAATTLGKVAIGRARPYAGLGNHEFRPFKNQSAYRSFPSGHTTNAFAVSAVLASRIKNPWASAGLYGLAALTATSRIYSRDHWLSDVVFAAAYTTAVAHSVVNWFEHENSGSSHGFNLTPTPDGVSVVWRF